jgi:tetratricopeptide (TPR) repeat protein
VKLLPKGSKRFWTDSHIQAFIESTAEKTKQQVQASNPGEPPKPIDFAPLIRDWAEKYGFTPEEAKAQIDKWVADVEKSQQDFYKLCLAAFADRNFGKAGDLFAEAGQNSEKQLKAVEKRQGDLEVERTALLRETVRNYQKEGDAHYSEYAFLKAQAAYQKALTFVDRQSEPALWAQTQVEMGMASEELATRSDGSEVARNFGHAVASYRAALEVRTRQQLPQDWAATQNNLDHRSVESWPIWFSSILYFQRKMTGSALICSK